MISFDQNTRTFKLDTKNTSYVIGMTSVNHLLHLYWGSKIPDVCDKDRFILFKHKSQSPSDPGLNLYSTNLARMEYPTHGGASA